MNTALRSLTFVAALAAAFSASAITLVQYNVPGADFAPTSTAAGVTADALNTVGSTAVLEPAVFGEGVFLKQSVVATDSATAVAAAQYFQFTFAPNAGSALNLTSLVFDAARGGNTAPRGFALRSSLDAFATDVATNSIPTIDPDYTNYNIDLTGPMFQSLTSATTFRIYQYVPQAGNGVYYDNLTLSGSITPVPEPASFAALALGLAALRRRRSR